MIQLPVPRYEPSQLRSLQCKLDATFVICYVRNEVKVKLSTFNLCDKLVKESTADASESVTPKPKCLHAA